MVESKKITYNTYVVICWSCGCGIKVKVPSTKTAPTTTLCAGCQKKLNLVPGAIETWVHNRMG